MGSCVALYINKANGCMLKKEKSRDLDPEQRPPHQGPESMGEAGTAQMCPQGLLKLCQCAVSHARLRPPFSDQSGKASSQDRACDKYRRQTEHEGPVRALGGDTQAAINQLQSCSNANDSMLGCIGHHSTGSQQTHPVH